VTFKELQRLVAGLSELGSENRQPLSKLRDKEFWIWEQTKHKQKHGANKGHCCFNHIIGLPTKDGVRKPMFDYERQLYKALLEPGYLNSVASMHSQDPNNIAHSFKLKHLWVKKATGLGVTEFMLRFMAWLLDAEKEEWFCNRCHVSYFPNKGEKVRRASKFETPGPLTDAHDNITGEKEPLVSMVDDSATTAKPRRSVFPRSLESLKRPGVTITGFSSTVDNEGL
jgi:hypothetical protein